MHQIVHAVYLFAFTHLVFVHALLKRCAMHIYLDFSILLAVHLNQGVFSRVRRKILPITPVILCLVLKLFLKVLDSILDLFEVIKFMLSRFPLNLD